MVCHICTYCPQVFPNLFFSFTAEEERIRKCKGRVFALQDEPEVARVWLPNNDSPGLAMARAFGDFCLKDFGLISVPEVSYRRLTEKDEFVVLATDGVQDLSYIAIALAYQDFHFLLAFFTLISSLLFVNGRFGMFSQTKKWWTSWQPRQGVPRPHGRWSSQRFAHGGTSIQPPKWTTVPWFASFWTRIRTKCVVLPMSSSPRNNLVQVSKSTMATTEMFLHLLVWQGQELAGKTMKITTTTTTTTIRKRK